MLYKSYSFLIILFLMLGSCHLKQQGSLKESNAEVVADSANHVLADTASIQFTIPFDNFDGVPFETFKMGTLTEIAVTGFEVDDQERLYFMGGDTATLAIFENEKQLLRKKYSEFTSSSLHLFDDKLIVFDKYNRRNNIFHLNAFDGELLQSFEKVTDNIVNSFHFQDSTLTLWIFGYGEQVSMDSEMAYVQYNLNGMLQGIGANLYAGLGDVWPNDYNSHGYEFHGRWKEYFVFSSLGSTTVNGVIASVWQRFVLVDKKGEVLYEKNINEKYTGEFFYGLSLGAQEHRKLRNEKIYMLSRKGDNAVITVLPLAGLFPGID